MQALAAFLILLFLTPIGWIGMCIFALCMSLVL